MKGREERLPVDQDGEDDQGGEKERGWPVPEDASFGVDRCQLIE
ncbi:MAG: hypothetical protein V1789_11895 [PVC group bacterium]